MDDLAPIIHALGGSLERHELLDLGWTDTEIRRAMRAGLLVRIRFGAYAHGASWRASPPDERHRILARAVLSKLGRHVIATHQTAAALHGLDVWGSDLRHVQVGRLDGRTARIDAGVQFHRGTIDPDDLVEVDGVLAVSPARAAVETALVGSFEAGAVAMTAALRDRGVTRDEITEMVDKLGSWAGALAARRAMNTADPRLETVGEVRSMCLFRVHAIALPEPQVEIRDAAGRLVARTDFLWERARHVGEFDGLVKYGRLNPYETDVGRVLVDEKRREDAVRRLSYGVSRWTWSELAPAVAAQTAGRIREDLERSRVLAPRAIDLGA